MAIASMIVQPAAGRINQVAAELAGIPGVTVHATTQNQQIIILLEAPSLEDVNHLARAIEHQDGVWGVFPAYVNTEV